jgi:tetratricopeptide (TPR) repeat protein
MDEGDHRAAIGHLREVVRLDPKNHEAQLDLGICYAQKGFYDEAERAYLKAGELAPDELLVHYDLAALYAQWQRPDEALTRLGKALEKDAPRVKGWLATDSMFDSLKGHAAFEALLGR